MANRFSGIIKKIYLWGSFAAILLSVAAPLKAAADVSPTATNPVPTAKVSFTFDDGLATTYTNVLPILKKYGLTGTDYVITGCVGMATVPNTCHANTDTSYMSWTQIKALQAAGWDIGSHTVTHPYLATSDATDGQPNVLTYAQVTQELVNSKAALAAQGINATDFAAPYGDYNMSVLSQIAKYYNTMRGFADTKNNDWPYNEFLLNDMPVQEGVKVTDVKAKIDDAIANKRWLILTMHDVKAKPSKNPDDYEYSTAELDQIAAYVQQKQTAGLIKSVNVNQGPVSSTTNLLANGSFNDGIADGWTTDNASVFTSDSGTNGSYPDPTKSIKFTMPATGNSHLYSPTVNVDPNTTYLFKDYLNVQTRTTGEVGFYVDEYDVNGNWVSGKYLKAEPSIFVENLNMVYKPSSVSVTKARLQVIVSGSGLSGYIDNSQWFPLQTTTPILTNMMTNGSFDAGISQGWTTDNPAAITADANNNGSPNNPVNSVKMVAGTTQAHLFGPRITVDPTKQYQLSTYLKLQAITSGEVGFYVDEYDANGNWISGQYKFGVRNVSTGDVNLSYTPSSTSVKTASLQVILVANSGITAYVDDVRWYLVQ